MNKTPRDRAYEVVAKAKAKKLWNKEWCEAQKAFEVAIAEAEIETATRVRAEEREARK